MKFDHSKLLGRIRELGFTQKTLAKAIGINESTLNGKLNNKTPFTMKDIDRICEVLNIHNSEIGTYFYTR